MLRLGRFIGLTDPGPFWIIPIVDTIPTWVDHRVMVTSFTAERTLTKDTVPVDVAAVLLWVVWDAEKAALEVEDYRAAIAWAAQTALREIIGHMDLVDILVGWAKMDAELQCIIDDRTTPWGHCSVGGSPRYCHPRGIGGRHEPSGAGGAGATSAGHPRRERGANRRFVCQGRRSLPGQPHSAPPAGGEYALLRLEREGSHGHRLVQRRGHDELGKADGHDGNGRHGPIDGYLRG